MARIDSNTHTRMWQGFYFESLGIYLEGEEDALAVAQENGYSTLDESYKNDFHYWTEWESEEFPFEEGEDYWTIEDGQVVHSVWDSESEELYMNAAPDKTYFFSEEEANEFLHS